MKMTWCPVVLLVWLCALLGAGAHRCHLEPEDYTAPRSSNAANLYRIQISGDHNTYVPEKTYKVILKGARSGQNTQTFTGFTLAVEPAPGPIPGSSSGSESWGGDSSSRVGNMSILGDNLTMYGLRCPNTVIQTSTMPKSEVQVLWRAPQAGSGCVVIRAMVIELPNLWYMDEGGLSLRLCESPHGNHDKQPDVLAECCACEEAKYEMTFEGMWSRHTHPKDFPDNNWLTRFSDVIGASHTADYHFWEYNGLATEGVREVAETGLTRELEKELKAESQHIRTIIKARGIGYPNVTGKTFAVFRVDYRHHLMSIVSMIYPSPDWIVGVSGLELCLKNCSWVDSVTLNLYPWDVGTDSGLTYMSEDSPTNPREPIRRITSSYPNDENSPFYDPSGTDIKPLARIQLTRQRLYEKSCIREVMSVMGANISSRDMECAVTPWKEDPQCSPPCGTGRKMAQRNYMHPELAEKHGCNVALSQRIACEGPPCSKVMPSAQLNPECDVTEWSSWSECSSPCNGTRTRERWYKKPDAYKYCSSLYDAYVTQEEAPCEEEGDGEACNYSTESLPPDCHLGKWSLWSVCSVTCGEGVQVRKRVGMHTRARPRMRVEMDEDMDTSMNKEDFSTFPEECSKIQRTQTKKCRAAVQSCEITPERARVVCLLPRNRGLCRRVMNRWYFDSETASCHEFVYTGCRGNENNFDSREECESVCEVVKENTSTDYLANILKPHGHIPYPDMWDAVSTPSSPRQDAHDDDDNDDDEDNDSDHTRDDTGRPVNCKMSSWSQWSECSATCGSGFKWRTRYVKVRPKNGGKPCGILKKTRRCKLARCVSVGDCQMSEWTEWSPCPVTCGHKVWRYRSRAILGMPGPGGKPCGPRVQTSTVECDVPRCEDVVR